MRYKDLTVNETQIIPNMNKFAKKVIDKNFENWKNNSIYIADMDDFKIKKFNELYTVWDEDLLVAMASLDDTLQMPLVDDVWVNPEYRGQHLFSKILWFFKTRLGHPQLLLGNMHSKDMSEVIKKMPRFNKFWVKDDQKIPFDPNTIDQFYSYSKPTGWQIMLENDGDFSICPMFNSGIHWIRESYDWCYRLD